MGMMNSDGFGIADAMALVNGKDNGGMGSGGTIIWVFFLFFLLAWGGNGFFGGNNGGAVNNAAVQGALTRSDMFEGFNLNDINRHLDDLQTGIYQGFYTTNNAINSGFQNVNATLNEARFDAAKCCCETNRNIDAVRYENAKNTCDIINAGHADAQRIIDIFTQNEVQKLRDQLQSAHLELNNVGQTQALIEALRPYPHPAYVTCSPYEAVPITPPAAFRANAR